MKNNLTLNYFKTKIFNRNNFRKIKSKSTLIIILSFNNISEVVILSHIKNNNLLIIHLNG